MGWLLRAFGSGLLKWVGFQVATLAGPLVIGIVTTTLGRADGSVTWMWAACAGALAFGGSAAGAYYLIGIAEKFRVKGRLSFSAPRITHDIQSGDIALGFDVKNLADVSLEYEVKEIRTQLDDLFPPNRAYTKKIFEIPPGGYGWFSDYSIQGSRPGGDARIVRGTIQVELLYGRPGARKHKLAGKWIVHLQYGSEPNIETIAWEVAD